MAISTQGRRKLRVGMADTGEADALCDAIDAATTAIGSATAAELAVLAGVTPGTGAASKALVLDSSGNVVMPTAGSVALSRASIAAAGSAASDATVLTGQINYVTASDGVKGVALPAAATTIGPIWVVNTVADKALFVYPVNGGNDNVNGLAEDLPLEVGGGEAVLFIPASATQWYTPVPHNLFNHEVVAAANVITAFESGKTFYLNLAAGFTSTLPAPALGLRFKFIVKTAPTGAPYVIVTSGGANLMYGMMLERAGTAGVAGAARDTFNFVHTQSIIGDWVEFYSDGTNWYYHGMVDVAAGNTVAQT